jgi:hypothetical protein
MTLRQKLVLKAIDKAIKDPLKNNTNVSDIMRDNGYPEVSVRSGTVRKYIRRHTQQLDICDPECIKKDIKYVTRTAKKKGDLTNLTRNIELRTRIAGMIVEKSQDVPTDKPDNQFSMDRLSRLSTTDVYKPVNKDVITVNKPVDSISDTDVKS